MFKNPTFFKKLTDERNILKDKFTELPLDFLIEENNNIKTLSPSKLTDFNVAFKEKQANCAIQLFTKADQTKKFNFKYPPPEVNKVSSLSNKRQILFPNKVISNNEIWKNSNILSSYILPCHIENLFKYLEYGTKRKPFDFEELVNTMTTKADIKKLKPNQFYHGKDIVPCYLLKKTKKINSKKNNSDMEKTVNMSKSIIKAYKLYGSRTNDPLNITFVGSSKSGKSTLIGNILIQLGVFSKTFIKKTEWDATKLNSTESKIAWLLDTLQDERQFHETILSSSHFVEIEGKSMNINDTPGNLCYFDQMIKSLLRCDQVVLVINLKNDWCDATQTFVNIIYLRNIFYILKVLNIDKLNVLFVNSFNKNIINPLSKLQEMWKKFFQINITHLTVDNLSNPQPLEIQSIIELITNIPLKSNELGLEKPLLVDILDIYKPVESFLPVVVGRVLRGGLSSGVNNALSVGTIIPEKIPCTIKSMKIQEKDEVKMKSFAFSQDLVELTFPEITSTEKISLGSVICHPEFPLISSSNFLAEVRIFDFDIDLPIINGINVLLWSKSRTCFCQLTKIMSVKYSSHKQIITKKFPRLVQSPGSSIRVQIKTEELLAIELSSKDKFDIFFLFSKTKLFAAGKFVDIIH